jgi:hypothetical protein
MSASELTEDEVEEIRSGANPDLTVQQVAALMVVFGLEPSYLVDRKVPPSPDAELLEGLSDETRREIVREALRLAERERGIVLGVVRQFGEARQAPPPKETDAARMPRPLWSLAYVLEKTPN